jgi:hypothetical protein
MTNLDVALEYAGLGYRILPLRPADPNVDEEDGKKPAISAWQHRASSEEAIVRDWWGKNPEYNLGIHTAGIIVVDIDPLPGGQENTWPDDPQKAMDLAQAPYSRTPRGGRHYFFKQPDFGDYTNSAGRLAPNVDVRATGGFVAAYPSVTVDGAYEWVEPLDVPPNGLPLPPDWLIESLNNQAKKPLRLAGENLIAEGQRNETMMRFGGLMRRHGASRDEIEAALLRMNENRCNPPLSDAEIMRVAQNVSQYSPDQVSVALTEGHYYVDREEQREPLIVPPPAPERLLYIPGFIGEMVDYCMDVSPYPNQALAFCGALAMQSYLIGRKLRDEADIRPNLYILGLANSGAGKNSPRTLNQKIAVRLGFIDKLGNQFGSGEGVEDAMRAKTTMLVQTDEMDKMLQAIGKSKEARYENLMATLLSMYSDSSGEFICRILAGGKGGEVISQPHLVIFGTAIPQHYYGALSEAMLSNGFFSRTIVIESAGRPLGQTPKPIDPPKRILKAAQRWIDFRVGGNLADVYPEPQIVPCTPEARERLSESQALADAYYRDAESARDVLRMSIYNRKNENIRKLALIYAASATPKAPLIGVEAVEWATEFMGYQVERMIHQAGSHVAENPFHDKMLKVKRIIGEAENQRMTRTELIRRMRIEKKVLDSIVETMHESGIIKLDTIETKGRSKTVYVLSG